MINIHGVEKGNDVKFSKRILIGLLFTLLLLSIVPLSSLANTTYQAVPTSSQVMIDGHSVPFEAFNINGNNYFKLRDLAKSLDGTDKQFEVGWDGAKNAISLSSQKPYTIVGGELAVSEITKTQTATLTSSTIYVDGQIKLFAAFNISGNNYFKLRDIGQTFGFNVGWSTATNTITIDTTGNYETVVAKMMKVTFIDVGQGDSELIQFPNGKTMLIDGGTGDMYGRIAAVLADNKITRLDVVIGTHTDDDHIGSLPGIIKNYEVGSVYLNGTSDTRTYLAFVREAVNKGLSVKHLYQGDVLNVDPSVGIKVFSPIGVNVDSDNDNSPIMKLVYKNRSFLFTGDAEKAAEDDALIYNKIGLKSDVVKVGHHGSTTSSSPAFALAVSPSLAIIEVGADNSYGHPDEIVVNRWQLLGTKAYSTAINGAITVKTDGNSLELFAKKSINPMIKALNPGGQTEKVITPVQVPINTIEAAYIGNKNTKVFHYPNCSSVDRMNSANKILLQSREEAIAEGFKPCQICKP